MHLFLDFELKLGKSKEFNNEVRRSFNLTNKMLTKRYSVPEKLHEI